MHPFFMQSASNLHQLNTMLTVTTSRLVQCADWQMAGLGDVYPIRQTQYAVNWTSRGPNLETHLRSINAKCQAEGRSPPFLQILTREGKTTSLHPPKGDEDPSVIDQIDDADLAPGAGDSTLVATGFPSYAPEQAICKVVANWLGERAHEWPPEVIAHSSNVCSPSQLSTTLHIACSGA